MQRKRDLWASQDHQSKDDANSELNRLKSAKEEHHSLRKESNPSISKRITLTVKSRIST